MRVSKIVREYIENEIEKKIPIPRTEYDEVMDNYRESAQKVEKSIREFASNQIEALKELYPELNIKNCINNVRLFSPDLFDNKLYKEHSRQIQRVKEIRDVTLNGIIVTLELGGNKSDLDRMLNEIRE